MGGHSSSIVVTDLDATDIQKIQERLGKKYAVPIDVQVAYDKSVCKYHSSSASGTKRIDFRNSVIASHNKS